MAAPQAWATIKAEGREVREFVFGCRPQDGARMGIGAMYYERESGGAQHQTQD